MSVRVVVATAMFALASTAIVPAAGMLDYGFYKAKVQPIFLVKRPGHAPCVMCHADAIGVRLARLASGVQVIAVTHAPQVAARADRHYLITKDALSKGKRVATRVVELADERRREEIARMLAGAEITAEARAAAERLIRAAS